MIASVMFTFILSLTFLLAPHIFGGDQHTSPKWAFIQESVVGPASFDKLASFHTRTELIDQRTQQIQKELYDAEEILALDDLIPPALQAPLSRWSGFLSQFAKEQQLEPLQKLLVLVLLVDYQNAAPTSPLPEKIPPAYHHRLMEMLLTADDIRTQTKLKLKFTCKENVMTNMLDTIIATEMGILSIPVPRNLMKQEKWSLNGSTYSLGDFIAAHFETLKEIVRVEKFGYALHKKSDPSASFLSKCQLLEYVKSSHPPELTATPNATYTLWRIILVHQSIRDVQVLFSPPDMSIHSLFQSTSFLFKNAPDLQGSFVQAIIDTVSPTHEHTYSPTLALHLEFTQMWCPQIRALDSFGTEPAELALTKAQDLICLGHKNCFSPPSSKHYIRCILSDNLVCDFTSTPHGMLILFPTKDALQHISSRHEYVRFATSHRALCTAIEAFKNTQEAQLGNSDRDVVCQYLENEGSNPNTEYSKAYQRFLARGESDKWLLSLIQKTQRYLDARGHTEKS